MPARRTHPVDCVLCLVHRILGRVLQLLSQTLLHSPREHQHKA